VRAAAVCAARAVCVARGGKTRIGVQVRVVGGQAGKVWQESTREGGSLSEEADGEGTLMAMLMRGMCAAPGAMPCNAHPATREVRQRHARVL